MTEKFYLEWTKVGDTQITEKDFENMDVFLFSETPGIGPMSCHVEGLVTININSNWHWANRNKISWYPEFEKDIATPEECEARKADQDAKEILEGETEYECGECQEEFTGNDGVCPLCGYGKHGYGWIPGNEPETNGWKQITFKFGHTVIVKYRGDEDWGGYRISEIIAHKPITLSPPYVPPEPERELLCPYCDRPSIVIIKRDERANQVTCEDCDMRLPVSNDYERAKKELFEIYDKLRERKNNARAN